jgi:DNA polymerase-1
MPDSQTPQTLYLVDAHALIFQSFHAIGKMSSPSGLPTNALFGFTRDLLYLDLERQPDYLLCAFDAEGPTFRHELFTDYKATRPHMPEELRLQLEPIQELLQALRIPVLRAPGYEADDVVATLACAGAARGLKVFICSNDKDYRQLLSENIFIFNIRKKRILDRAALEQEWGIRPEQVVDLQVLMGDSVDNVPGVPGIGPKTAAQLLQKYGTLENLLSHLEEVPGEKRRRALEEARVRLPGLRSLVALVTTVPLEFTWEAWRRQPWDTERLLELFQRWGFRGFARQVRQRLAARTPAPHAETETREAPVLAAAAAPQTNASLAAPQTKHSSGRPHTPAAPPTLLFPPDDGVAPVAGQLSPIEREEGKLPASPRGQETGWQGNYHLIASPEEFDEFLARLRGQKRFALDLETTDLYPLRAEIVGLAFCWQAGEAWYVALRGPQGSTRLCPRAVLEALRPVLEDPQVAKVNQNIKYDWLVLRAQGIRPAGLAGDPMLADYLLHPGQRRHDLATLARTWLHHEVIPISELIDTGKPSRKEPAGRATRPQRMDQVPLEQIARYAGEDADVAWRLTELLEAELARQGLHRLYHEVEVPLIEVLAEMEFNGIRLDTERLRRLGEQMAHQLAELEQEIYRLAGHPFNLASPKQLAQVLFEELGLPVKRRTRLSRAPSTDQETLDWLASQGQELPRRLLEYRHLAKLKGTYVDTLPTLVEPRTGRIHASFNQTVTATGRLSSSEPNLQNIPIRSEEGGQIRQAFVPQEGWLLVAADYSQIELRLLAHFSQDVTLRRAFLEGQDIHTLVAQQIYGVAEEQVTPAMRRLAKTINFGVLYGMSDYGLAERLHLPREEASRFIDAWFAQYPQVREYQDRLLEEARRQGYVTTLLGRRRPFDPQVLRPTSTYKDRSAAEREAINTPIQGSAADLIKVAMVRVHRRLRQEGYAARLLLQIHDELVLEAPPEEVTAVTQLLRQEMTQALPLEVPLVVDVAVGPNWLDTQPVEK